MASRLSVARSKAVDSGVKAGPPILPLHLDAEAAIYRRRPMHQLAAGG
jgi:hypothetical protein